jgi:hypothetical protein
VKASKAVDDVLDKEREFEDIGTDYADELTDAEREVIQARRDHERAIDDVTRKEQDLQDLRSEIASNRAYREAQRELERAEMDVADAVLQQARNLVDRETALREANGETVTAQTQNDLLRQKIELLTTHLAGPGLEAVNNYKDALRDAWDFVPTPGPDSVTWQRQQPRFKGVAQIGGYTGNTAGYWLLHPNELILPLDDRKKTMELLARFGLLAQTRDDLYAAGKLPVSAGASRTESITYGGDQINIPVMNGPSASEISDEYTWRRFVNSRN